MMFSFKIVAFVALITICEAYNLRLSFRYLSEELIAGFEPQTTVTDHNAIDLDQKAMESELGKKTTAGFANARRIYTEGGNSKSYAVLTINGLLGQNVMKGDEITGITSSGSVASGNAFEDTPSGSSSIKVQYKISDKQDSYVGCQVGGLPEPNLSGCFNETGIVVIGGGTQYSYFYIPAEDNNSNRTLRYFSDTANTRMRVNGEGSYYEDFQKFYDYYGRYDYADALITAAFDKTSVNLGGKAFDFTGYSFTGQAEVIKKSSAYISTSMYVIRELEDALDDCTRKCGSKCNDDAVQALDEAVAFYTGSLEGRDGSGEGVLHYSLADKRCVNFKTCGPDGTELKGTSKVNIEIFKHFDIMQQNLLMEQCSEARKSKENIAKKMWVPLIQGTLRYAYIRSMQAQDDEKAEAEGAAFAAGVLPIIASCKASDADVIYRNMRPASNVVVDFAAVKAAFENNYGCIGISCADVGGLYNDATGSYFDGAGPCGSSSRSSSASGVNVGLAVGLSVGLVIAAVILSFLFVVKRQSNTKDGVEFKVEPNANHT